MGGGGKGKSKPTPQLEGKRRQFTATNQPTPEAKADGWKKKRTAKELVQHVLESKFIGAKDSKLVKTTAEYFGVDPEFITVEMMIIFRAAEKAISKADLQASKLLLERAHGLPKQEIENIGKPEIHIHTDEETKKELAKLRKSAPHAPGE